MNKKKKIPTEDELIGIINAMPTNQPNFIIVDGWRCNEHKTGGEGVFDCVICAKPKATLHEVFSMSTKETMRMMDKRNRQKKFYERSSE